MPHDLFGTPVIAAPMAGGTSTPAFVEAVHRAGGLGFLAAGYKSVAAMQAEIRTIRESGARFGMNVFVPDPAQLAPSAAVLAELEEYRLQLRADARRYGVELPQLRLDDDDEWQGKIDALLADPVELVSFTFGLPGPGRRPGPAAGGVGGAGHCHHRGRGRQAAEQGVDALVVQHASAGGHSAAFLPAPERGQPAQPGGPQPGGTTAELVAEVRSAVDLPLVAAGGDHGRGRAGRRAARRGRGSPARHRVSPHGRKRRPAAAQGCPGRSALHPDPADARLHRPAGPGPGERIRPRPPRGAGGLPCRPPPHGAPSGPRPPQPGTRSA